MTYYKYVTVPALEELQSSNNYMPMSHGGKAPALCRDKQTDIVVLNGSGGLVGCYSFDGKTGNEVAESYRQATAKAQLEKNTCLQCEQYGESGPRHKASNRCESGKKNHCSCDRCF